MVIDIDGSNSVFNFGNIHTQREEEEDRGRADEMEEEEEEEAGETKRRKLVAEILAYKSMPQ
jgi:hypothetical protein